MKPVILALPLFVAESTFQGVPSSTLGEWLVQAAAAAVLITVGWNLIDRLRGGAPQKREVSFSAQYATREEHQKLREDFEHSVERLHERIDKVPERTIALLSETKQLHGK